jgi:flagellar motor switch/type III secretory pathway protein FliN
MTVEEVVARLGNMAVQLEFELDRRTVSLREVADLRPGQVLAVAHSPAEQVSVRAGGIRFALAEIVGDGAKVKVRITRFAEVENHR